MKVIVFGATGGVGQEAVRRAVAAGYEVTAFVRTPAKLQAPHGVHVVEGDAFDREAVTAAIRGHDAVICALGSSRGMRRSTELAEMATNIAHGMRSAGIDRIAYCASAGVEGELTGPVGSLVAWLLRHPLADHRAALDALADAGIRPTVARPTSLTDGAFTRDYVEMFHGLPPASGRMPRASVADFLVRALGDPETYVGASVGLSVSR